MSCDVFWASVIAGAVMAALSLGGRERWEFGKAGDLRSEWTVQDAVLQTEVLQQATPQMALVYSQ